MISHGHYQFSYHSFGKFTRFNLRYCKKPDTDDEESDLALDVPPFAEGQTFGNPPAKVTAHHPAQADQNAVKQTTKT